MDLSKILLPVPVLLSDADMMRAVLSAILGGLTETTVEAAEVMLKVFAGCMETESAKGTFLKAEVAILGHNYTAAPPGLKQGVAKDEHNQADEEKREDELSRLNTKPAVRSRVFKVIILLPEGRYCHNLPLMVEDGDFRFYRLFVGSSDTEIRQDQTNGARYAVSKWSVWHKNFLLSTYDGLPVLLEMAQALPGPHGFHYEAVAALSLGCQVKARQEAPRGRFVKVFGNSLQ